MTNEYSPDQQPEYFDPEQGLYDPTGLIHEVPEDPNLLSWLKTAYFVRRALEESPDNSYLEASQPVISEAIIRRNQDLQLQRRHQRLHPPQS